MRKNVYLKIRANILNVNTSSNRIKVKIKQGYPMSLFYFKHSQNSIQKQLHNERYTI